MSINILNKIDFASIDKGVAEYEAESPIFWNQRRYLIMSERTRDRIAEECNQYVIHRNDYGSEYRGMRIAIDNALELGEVEIR